MKLAVLYAGQGAQHPGMGKEFYEGSPAFRAAFDSAELDFDLHRVCFEDPDGLLNQTEYTQPCMVAFACGVTAVLAQQGVKPAYVAGLSLGEYSALEAAGVFTAKQAIELAAYRGKAMAEAAKGIDCGMTAVLNLDRQALAACSQQAASACRSAGHRRRESRCGQSRRTGQRSRCPPLHPAQGKRPVPHPPHGPRRGCTGKAFCV